MHSSGNVIPFSFDLSTLVQRSVASLYSHLVTRPTGRALRLGIESQIGEIGSVCLSVLDFTQVVVLDYSCADEAVAKLIQRYQLADRPADAYFVARGLGEQHRDPIDEVLIRHDLALVAEVEGEFTLLGCADELEHQAWHALQRVRLGRPEDVAVELDATAAEVGTALDRLASRRVVLRRGAPDSFCALTTLLPER
ncbi:MAG TPA: hypothetical protein VHG09_06535 [Longimicrobiales bacterium]|nr:hypothetical protein [Longimicrobiales bacterium]